MTLIFCGNEQPDKTTKQCGKCKEKVNAIVPKYEDLLKPKTYVHETIQVPLKSIFMMYGEPTLRGNLLRLRT